MKVIEIAAKTVDKAIADGLKKLGASSIADGITLEILSNGGFLKKAKVRLTKAEEGDDKKVEVKKEEPKKVEPKKVEPKKEKAEVKKEEKKEEKKVEKAAPVKKEKPAPTVDTRPVIKEEKKEEKPHKSVSEAQVKLVRDYLEKLLPMMKIDAKVEIDTSHGNIDVNLVTEDAAAIGHHGEVLDALQLLAKRAAEEGEDKYIHVNVDSQNYRVRREKSLVSLAHRMAKKCEKTGRRVTLEPMSNTHRKIIHATLSSSDKVTTKSEGNEPNRKVVIYPKRNDNKR
jgi:spoIIIJ-associated protein